MTKGMYEILKEANDKKTEEERIAVLHANSGWPLKMVLGWFFSPKIEWNIPEGVPPFTRLPSEGDHQGRFYAELEKLGLFLKESAEGNKMSSLKREMLFIRILETIDQHDADLLIAMKDKKMPFTNITKELVAKAFPKVATSWV